MAKKKIEVVTVQSVKHEGKYPPVGTKIKVDEEEASRLISLGAVELPRPEMNETAASKPSGTGASGGAVSPSDADLIEKIKSVTSLAELEALNIENPSDAVLASAAEKAKEFRE